MMYKLAPSILAADFARLGENVKTAADAGAEMLHLDVMDGRFVPSISFGMPVIASLRPLTAAEFDVHLMIEEPERYVEDFVKAGADIITVHSEACRHLDRTVQLIHSFGKKAGISLNPATSLSVLDYVLDQADMVLLMSVNPGFGGQKYLPYISGKIKSLRERIDSLGLTVDIQVDGGVHLGNAKEVLDAGANILVAGSAIFNGSIQDNVKAFQNIMAGME